TASSDPAAASHSTSNGEAPPGVWAQVLVPVMPAVTPPRACSVAAPPPAAYVTAVFSSVTADGPANAACTAERASARSTAATTSASVIQTGSVIVGWLLPMRASEG